MFTIGEAVGLAEWIIDDTYIVFFSFALNRCDPILTFQVLLENVL